ncbi:MAG: hypothetical protein HOP02_12785 [Methylococcaceae bacterium]|nr:hypothetical protein [Methylococcaceae bacterium]
MTENAQGDVILDHSQLSSGTEGSGLGCNITVNAGRNLQMVNSSKIKTNSAPDKFSLSQGGDAGNISLQAKEIQINTVSAINSSTSSSGRAGNIDVQADNVSLNKGYIGSLSQGANSSGNTGTINITANNRVDLTDSTIGNFSEADLTEAAAKAIKPGVINLTAQQINFDNGTVSADANGNNGIASDVVLNARDINLSNNSGIGSLAKGNSNGGNVFMTAHDIHFNHSIILTDAKGTGAAGKVNISFAHWLTLDHSYLSTIAKSGNGGAITLQGGELFSLRNSAITTTVEGGLGNGGNINVTADILLMDTGILEANAASGNGGDINLNLKGLIPSGDSLILGGANIWNDTAPTLNIIQAVSESGINGVTKITAPQLNLSGVLSNLGAPLFDSSVLSPDYCNLGAGSTLSRKGRGGLLPKGSDLSF